MCTLRVSSAATNFFTKSEKFSSYTHQIILTPVICDNSKPMATNMRSTSRCLRNRCTSVPVMEDSRETERSYCTPELGLTATSVVEQPQASKTGNENNTAGIGKKTLPESSQDKNSRQKWEKE